MNVKHIHRSPCDCDDYSGETLTHLLLGGNKFILLELGHSVQSYPGFHSVCSCCLI